MTDTAHQLTLVLGATGKTGRRVLDRLDAAGVPTRAGSRPHFDWERPETWPGALEGVAAVYISYFPDLAVPGAPETVGAFARLAVASGARRLVLLSGRGEEEAQAAEEAVKASGGGWTILRCSFFAQNFSESFLLEPVRAGEVVLPVGDVGEPFVDVEDIAELAVAALTDPRHAGELYELTGPRLLSFSDAVVEVARASGREISFIPVTVREFAGAMREGGEPEEVVGLISYLFGEVLDGRNASLADGVQRGLGRPPTDFAAYAARAAASGAWAA